MNLFCFSSETKTNIWAGIGAQLWAVSDASEQTNQARATASRKMPIGSSGLLYCKQTQQFTTPFIVYSEPDAGRVVSDIWPESWRLPFRIKTLGTPERTMSISEMMELPAAKASGKANVSHVFFIHGQLAFTPTAVTEEDWKVILSRLAV